MSIPSIPSITSITEVGRVPGSTTSRSSTTTATAAAAVRQGGANAPAPGDAASTEPPTPPRFPWLSRLSQQLESAARQKPAFPSAPVLGDNLDRAV